MEILRALGMLGPAETKPDWPPSFLVDSIRRLANETWTPDGVSPVPQYVRVAGEARHSLNVLDRIGSPLLRDPKFLGNLERQFGNPDFRFRLMFDDPGDLTYLSQGAKRLHSKVPDLRRIQEQHESQFEAYWVPRDVRLVFAVADGNTAIFSRPNHTADQLPATVTRHGDKKWANYLTGIFETSVRDLAIMLSPENDSIAA